MKKSIKSQSEILHLANQERVINCVDQRKIMKRTPLAYVNQFTIHHFCFYFLGIKDPPIDAKRHPKGPSFSLFPHPVIDRKWLWGGPCSECIPKCYGHYVTDIQQLINLNTVGLANYPHGTNKFHFGELHQG